VPESTRVTDGFALAFYAWIVTFGLVAEALVAAVTAAVTAVARTPLALFAGALTSIGSSVALFALPSLASCIGFFAIRPGATCAWSVQSVFVRDSFEQMLFQGTVAALVGAGLGRLAVELLHRRRHAPLPRAAPAA
jgi:hypothetical protein